MVHAYGDDGDEDGDDGDDGDEDGDDGDDDDIFLCVDNNSDGCFADVEDEEHDEEVNPGTICTEDIWKENIVIKNGNKMLVQSFIVVECRKNIFSIQVFAYKVAEKTVSSSYINYLSIYSTSTMFLAGTLKGNTFSKNDRGRLRRSAVCSELYGSMHQYHDNFVEETSLVLVVSICVKEHQLLSFFAAYSVELKDVSRQFYTYIEKTEQCGKYALELFSLSRAGLQSGQSVKIFLQFFGNLLATYLAVFRTDRNTFKRIGYNKLKKKIPQFETNSRQKTSFNAKRIFIPTNLVKVVVVFMMMNLFFGAANGSGPIDFVTGHHKPTYDAKDSTRGFNLSLSLEPLQECVENNGDFHIRCTINKEEENVYTWRQNTTTLFKDGKRHKNIDEEKYEEMTKGNSSTLMIKNFTEDDRNSIIHCYNGFLHTKLNLTNLNLTCKRDEGNKTGLNIMYVALPVGITVGVMIAIVFCGVLRYRKKIRKKLKGCCSPALQENHFQDEDKNGMSMNDGVLQTLSKNDGSFQSPPKTKYDQVRFENGEVQLLTESKTLIG